MSQSSDATKQAGDAAGRTEECFDALTRLLSRSAMQRAVLPQGSGLSRTDAWLLRRLAVQGPARMAELAQWQAVDRSTMTIQIRRLERAGLVARETDDGDRRVIIVTLTDAGRQMSEQISVAARTLYAEVMSHWSQRERLEFVESLEQFVGDLAAHLDKRAVTVANGD